MTRTLRRPLPGGVEVMTSRSYEIRFVAEPGGYRVEGQLLVVDVRFPPGFDVLARMERERADTGLFPMHLDANGRFIPQAGLRTSLPAAVTRAAALKHLPAELPTVEAADARNFIGEVSKSGVFTSWPTDLFNPVPGKRSDLQTIPLPGGKTGQVTIEIEASRIPELGILRSFDRLVSTRLGDATRVTHETWTLARRSAAFEGSGQPGESRQS